MERIVLIIGGENLSMPALDFTCYLARLTRSAVTGLFLESAFNQRSVLFGAAHTDPGVAPGVHDSPEVETLQTKMVEKNMALFKSACENRGVNCTIVRETGNPGKDAVAESRYADLLVIDPSTSFSKNAEETPTGFVKEILQHAECPVIIAPGQFDELTEIIFTYDGSRSAAFALKQFTYLFPQLSDKRVIVVQVNETGEWEEEEKKNISEWLKNRYSAIGFQALKGNTEINLFNFLFKRKNSLVVMGAYGRSPFSRFLHESSAELVIKTMPLPIFISHC